MPLTAFDDFARADAATLGASWASISGNHTIFSNQAKATSGFARHNVWAVDADTDDNYSELQFGALPGAGQTGPTCRVTDSSNYLRFYWDGAQLILSQTIAGVTTDLGTPYTGAVALSQVIRVEASGSSILGFLDGIPVASATTSLTTGKKVGLRSFSANGTTYAGWQGGDGASSVTPTPGLDHATGVEAGGILNRSGPSSLASFEITVGTFEAVYAFEAGELLTVLNADEGATGAEAGGTVTVISRFTHPTAGALARTAYTASAS